ncbi:MAG: SMC-Scp complex subunit ScpB [Alphaproteobacteria bacterium]|nr:SMC-Scp complex subunit ScpB [Alphaproteobacteria bacterium]
MARSKKAVVEAEDVEVEIAVDDAVAVEDPEENGSEINELSEESNALDEAALAEQIIDEVIEEAEEAEDDNAITVTDEDGEELVITQDDVRLVEAMLFATSVPLTIQQMAERFPENRVALIPDILEIIEEQYTARGVNLVQRDKRYALRTATDLADSLRLEREQPKKFTKAAMETMAVVAYHQPVTRAEIENIRGVATSPGSLDALLEAGWIKTGKRREVPGRPVTWLTTQAFLDHFGLESLTDLPGMQELKESGLLDKRPAIEAMPATGDLFEGDENEEDPQEVTDEDLLGNAALAEGEGLEDDEGDFEEDAVAEGDEDDGDDADDLVEEDDDR